MSSTGRPPRAREVALQWFRDNGPESTLASCVDATGVAPGTAAAARRQLKREGSLDEHFSPNDPGAGESARRAKGGPPPTQAPTRPLRVTHLAPEPENPPAQKISDIMDDALERVLAGAAESLTPKQALEYASELVKAAPTFQLKMIALREYNKMHAASEERDDLGPGVPHTELDREVRAAWILEACGTALAKRAWERAFREKIVEVHDLPPEVVETESEEPAVL